MGVRYLNKNQIPLLNVEPLHAVFRSRAVTGIEQLGFYDWTLQNAPPTDTRKGLVQASPRVDIDPNNLYAIEYFTFSADIDGGDFESCINDVTAANGGIPGIPRFSLYTTANASSPILKQPIPLPQYYTEATYPKWKVFSEESEDVSGVVVGGVPVIDLSPVSMKRGNQFVGAFEARLNQLVALVGKENITLILTLGIMEIRDEGFIKAYRHGEIGRAA
jgi:hypothetical protein